MKKLLALLLAILMIASIALVSCQATKTTGTSGGGNNVDDDTEDDGGLVIPDNFTTNTNETGSDSSSETGNGNNNNDNDDDNNSVDGFETVTSFSVYTYVSTKIRSSAMMSANSVKTVEQSAQLTVVAKKGDTWYKVKYGTDEGYVPQDFVSTNKDDTIFTEIPAADQKTITVKGTSEDDTKQVNIRPYPIISDFLEQTAVTLDYSKSAKKIGESKSGLWYKVSFEDKIYYLKINDATKPHILVDGQPIVDQGDVGI